MLKNMLLAFCMVFISTAAFASMDCMDIQEKDYKDPSKTLQTTVESLYKKDDDPRADLQGCFMDAGIRGVQKARQECACPKAVKKLCKFDKKKKLKWHHPDVPPDWCIIFND